VNGTPFSSIEFEDSVIGLGLGTYGAITLCRDHAGTGRIGVFAREDAKRAVDAVLADRCCTLNRLVNVAQENGQ
jgi:hypothetical protein